MSMAGSMVRRSAGALRAEEHQMRRQVKDDVAARRHVGSAVLAVPQLGTQGLGPGLLREASFSRLACTSPSFELTLTLNHA